LKTVELRRLESGVTMRWRRRAEEDGRKQVVGVARARRRDRDQAAEVVRRGRSGRQRVRQVLKRERRGQRWPHLHQEEEAEPMVVEAAAAKALEVFGRERDVEVELLLEGQLLEVRR